MDLFDVASVEGLRRKLPNHHIDLWGPPQHTSWVDEELSWKKNCYLGDWSFLRSFRYSGPDVFKLFADCSVNTMDKFAIGQSKHIIHTDENGKIIEEGVLSKTGDNEVVAHSTLYADFVRRAGSYDVAMEPISRTKYHLQGPNAVFVLEKTLGRQFRDIKFMRNEVVDIAGVETTVLRQGMSGELGFELQAPLDQGRLVWNALLEAGAEFDIHEMGGRVAMLNHLQAAYPTYGVDYLSAIHGSGGAEYLKEVMVRGGADILKFYFAIEGSYDSTDVDDWFRSPVELGWGNRIKFDHHFPGDEVLKAELAAPKRTLCTLRWNGDDVVDTFASYFRQGLLPDFMEMPQDPRGYVYGDKILFGDAVIGMSTSRGYSAHFREMLSLAVLDIEHSTPGRELEVVWGAPHSPQRRIRALVAPAPYKENRGRIDLHTLPTL